MRQSLCGIAVQKFCSDKKHTHLVLIFGLLDASLQKWFNESLSLWAIARSIKFLRFSKYQAHPMRITGQMPLNLKTLNLLFQSSAVCRCKSTLLRSMSQKSICWQEWLLQTRTSAFQLSKLCITPISIRWTRVK